MAAELGISFLDVGTLVFFAALASVLAVRLRVPPVLALLAAGVIIGPSAIGLIRNNDVVALMAELGAVLLLFSIGAEFSVSKLRQFGVKAFSIGAIKLAIAFWLAHQTALLFNLDGSAALYMAAILAITSTALTIKILEQKNLAKREEVPILVASLVIEDLFAVFALVFFSASTQADQNVLGLVSSLLAALAVLFMAYFVLLRILNRVMAWLSGRQTGETLVFLGLTLAIGFAYLAQQVGLSSSIGAFLAGSLVASLPKGKALETALSPFALAFSAIFFIAIGLVVDLSAVAEHAGLVIAFAVLGALYRFIGTGISTYLNGFSSKSAAFSGLAMMAAGEFSLVIASSGAKSVTAFDLVSVTSAIVFLSTLIMSVGVTRHESVHGILRILMPEPFQNAARETSMALKDVVNAFGHLPNAAREQIQASKWTAAGVSLVLAGTAVALWISRNASLTLLEYDVPAYALIFAASALLMVPLAARIGNEMFQVMSIVERRTKNASAFNWTALLGIIGLMLVVPFALRHAGRELLFGELVLLVLFLAAGVYAFNLKTPNTKSKSIFLQDERWRKK